MSVYVYIYKKKLYFIYFSKRGGDASGAGAGLGGKKEKMRGGLAFV